MSELVKRTSKDAHDAVQAIVQDQEKVLDSLYQHALETYQANGRSDYEAGIIEGIKRVQKEFGYR